MPMDDDNEPLSVLYRDAWLVAVHKPSGLLVHRSDLDRHETEFAVQLTRDLIGQRVYPFHRLDKATSGLLLFALDSQTADQMMVQFAEHRIQKRYLAVVRGYAEASGHIDYALVNKRDKKANQQPQSAVTDYRRLATVELDIAVGRYASARYSLLEVMPKTGRPNQIRQHLKHICKPIIGDTSFGEGRHNRLFRDHFNSHRLLLAATHLTFTHPHSGETMTLHAPLAQEYARVVHALGWSEAVADDV